MSGIKDRGTAIHALLHGDDGIVDQQDGVLGRDPGQHDDPDQGRHRQRLACYQQQEEGPAERHGQRRQNGDRVEEAAEQQDQHDVHQQDAGDDGEEEAGRRLLQIFQFARHGLADPLRQVLHGRQGIHPLGSLAEGDAVQLGGQGRDPLPVQAVNLVRAGPERDVGHRGQRHRGAGHGRDAQVLQNGQIAAGLLAQHHPYRDLPVTQIELGQQLVGVTERRHAGHRTDVSRRHTLQRRHIALGRYQYFGAHEGGRGNDIGQAGDFAHLALDRRGGLLQRFAVIADQLDRHLAALAVGTELNARAGNGAQHRAHFLFECLLAQRAFAALDQIDGDIGLADLARRTTSARAEADRGRTDRRIDRAHLGPFQQCRVDALHHRICLGQGRSRRQLDGDVRPRDILGRDELERQHGGEDERTDQEGRAAAHDPQPVIPAAAHKAFAEPGAALALVALAEIVQDPVHDAQIVLHPRRIAVLLALVALEHIGAHQRREGSRHYQREEDTDAGGDGEALEELPHDARHESRRCEHGQQGRRGRDNRQTDLIGRLDSCRIGRLAVAYVADNVLDLDDGVIDQNADGQRQRQQGHDVQRLAGQVHDPEGRNQRHGHGHRRDQRRPPVAQENEHHQHRQARAQQQGLDRGMEIVDHIRGGGGHLLDGDIVQFRIQGRDLGLAGLIDIELGRFLGAADAEADHLGPVVAGPATRLGPFIHHLTQIAQAHRTVADRDQGFAQIIDRLGRADSTDRLFLTADLTPSAGQVDVGRPQLVRHGRSRHTLGRQPGRVQLDTDLPADTAVAADLADAFQRQQSLGHSVVNEPAQLLGVHPGRAHDIGRDRNLGEFDPLDDRLLHIGGQVLAHTRDGVAHIIGGLFQVDTQLEGDGGCRHGIIDGRGDVVDLAQARHRVLDQTCHLGFQLGRRRARLDDRDRHNRQVDVREIVRRQFEIAQHPGDRQDDEQQHHRDRVPDRGRRDIVEIHRPGLSLRAREVQLSGPQPQVPLSPGRRRPENPLP